ncbi:HEAT repeat domain-containing protein [candidate division WOR-3 bacterium]|nr:HEAT repeat domain-containing protein [candidate division WOR-3 bacterium]
MRVLVLLVAVAVSVMAGPVKQYGPETWFEQDPAPVPIKAESIGNPLDYAGARIGLDVRNVELPRGWEGGYRYCCRFPIIDYVSNRPLYMKHWAETRSAALVRAQGQTGLAALERAYRIIEDMPESWGRGVASRYEVEVYEDWNRDRKAVRAARTDSLRAGLERGGFSPQFSDAVVDLYYHLYKAMLSLRSAKSRFLPGDSIYFAENPGRYLAPDGKRMAELTGNTDAQMEFVEHARRFQRDRVFWETPRMRWALERYIATTRGWKLNDLYSDTAKAGGTVSLELPLGRVVVSGFHNDQHLENAALLIDLGGDDTHLNNAGATGPDGGVAVCLDHAGNDKYLASDSSYVQGFGFLGIGMLVDLAGNDVYEAKHFSQGVGIMGVGVLWDKAGNDTFSAHTFCQGAGMFGLGTMLDDSGNDVYDCASNGQGSATTLGLGILSDLEGNDKYRLACDSSKDAMGGMPGYGQGGALSFRAYPWEKKLVAYGGVGMLVDDKGNDEYVSKGWNCQGGSYIMSLGVLVDNEGNDHYVCGTGQGSGIHVTNAILIDKKGDDVYEGGFRAGGSGSDRSPGFLIDYEGNDTYKSATSSYGTACKPFAYTLFIDYKGDDKYICGRPKGDVLFNDWHSFGGVWPESDPSAWPYAICLDLGGKDTYQVRNRANNSETHSFGHGLFLDMEWKGGDVIGGVPEPRDSVVRSMDEFVKVPLYLLGEPSDDRLGGLTSVWVLTRDGPGNIGDVAEYVTNALSWNVRLGLECIHEWFVQGKIGDKELPVLFTLLKAQTPEARLTIADDLGLWRMAKAESALIEVLKNDSNAQVRRFALRSLIRLESARAIPLARKLATEDTSGDVRRMAVTLVGKVKPDTSDLRLFRWLLAEDRASSVRCAAADAMGNLGDQRAVEPLRSAAMTYDVYVQRACGKALCALHQVDGIDLLIKSLSFPSIDAFYNYDRNVPNYISTFAGHDLPDSERYVQAKWQAWFDTHRDSINIKYNADAHKAWTNLTDSLRDVPDTAQIPRYEAFLKRFPTYERAKKELAGKLNGIAWNLATTRDMTEFRHAQSGDSPQEREDARYSPRFARALKYALRAVELSDDPNIWDTLVEAYLVNGRKAEALRVCREALAKHPGEQVLRNRLVQLERK